MPRRLPTFDHPTDEQGSPRGVNLAFLCTFTEASEELLVEPHTPSFALRASVNNLLINYN